MIKKHCFYLIGSFVCFKLFFENLGKAPIALRAYLIYYLLLERGL